MIKFTPEHHSEISFIKQLNDKTGSDSFLEENPYLMKCINQTDDKGNLSPKDTAYAINFYPGASHTPFHSTSLSFFSLLLNYQNTFTTYYNLLYISKSILSLFPGQMQSLIHIKNIQTLPVYTFYTSCAVFLCVLVLGSVSDCRKAPSCMVSPPTHNS